MKTVVRVAGGLLLALVLTGTASAGGGPRAIAVAATIDPLAIMPEAFEIGPGFLLVPEKSRQHEPTPGVRVAEAGFAREATPEHLASGPIEVRTLIAVTASRSQAAEQLASSRGQLTSSSWVDVRVPKLGDQSVGLRVKGTSPDGPAVAYLLLLRSGTAVIGVTVAGLEESTRMSHAEPIARGILERLEGAVNASESPPVGTSPLNPDLAATCYMTVRTEMTADLEYLRPEHVATHIAAMDEATENCLNGARTHGASGVRCYTFALHQAMERLRASRGDESGAGIVAYQQSLYEGCINAGR